MDSVLVWWRGGATGKAFGLAINRSRVQILLKVKLRNNLASCSHLCASVTTQYNLVLAKGRWCSAVGEVTAGLAESNGSLPPGEWLTVTCGLTACTPGSAPDPTLRVEYGKPLPLVYWYIMSRLTYRKNDNCIRCTYCWLVSVNQMIID